VGRAEKLVADDMHGLGWLPADRAVGGNVFGNKAEHLGNRQPFLEPFPGLGKKF